MIKLFNNASLAEASFSIFHSPITNNQSEETVNIFDLATDLIGDRIYENRTHTLRSITDKKENQHYKCQNFHYVTFSGIFNPRKDSGLIKHSNLICIDIDGLGTNLNTVKEIINNDIAHTIMTFTSPNGDGLKIIYPIDIDIHSQEEWYGAYTNHISKLCNISTSIIDSSCSNVSRACFICYDPDVFINPKIRTSAGVQPISVIQENPQISYESYETYSSEYLELDFKAKDSEDNFNALVNISIKKNEEYKSPREPWIQKLACRCNLFGMSKEKCLEYILKYFKNHPESIRPDNPIDVKTYLINPVEDTYKRYADNFGKWQLKVESDKSNTPTIPDAVYFQLPSILKDMCNIFSLNREKDVFLISSLTVLSACFPSVYGIYDDQTLGANLFAFITAPASAGKSTMKWSRNLIFKINKELKEESRKKIDNYLNNLDEGKRSSSRDKPKNKALLIPANNSSTGVIQSIADNDGLGLIFETEADTLSGTLAQEWGNFSDSLRKAFHHEPISYKRRKNDEYEEVESPHFSLLVSGTPEQVRTLIPNPENGLFSRFCFYSFDIEPVWKTIFKKSAAGNLKDLFESKSELFLRYYHIVKKENRIIFSLTEEQEETFNNKFRIWHNELGKLISSDIYATVRRLGVITFRIAMLLTTLRALDERKICKKLICKDDDFNSSIAITSVLIEHAVSVYQTLLSKNENVLKPKPLLYFRKLPNKFNRRESMEIAASLDIKEKTAESYLTTFITKKVLCRVEHNHYEKLG
jgi:Protein of unknown function (DUF3987)/VirE N-terminal domain